MADTSLPTTVAHPYLTYNFRVKWDGNYVAAVTSVSGLSRSTQVVAFHAGGQPQSAFKLPGQTDFAPITLQRGITTDTAFEQWANMVWYYPDTGQLGNQFNTLASFRKNIQIELYNQSGQLALRYNVYNCWPSEFTSLPDLQSEANVVAIASLTLQHEGWDRDLTVQPPTPPTG